MITRVKTEYEVELATPVILTNEYRYPETPERNTVTSAYEITNARVTVQEGERPFVRLLGWRLVKTGERSKRRKEAEWLGRTHVVTYTAGGKATFDSSAYDKVVATVMAEIAAVDAGEDAVNTNVLYGMACPQCGSEEAIDITVTITGIAHATDDGFSYDDISDASVDWSKASKCRCPSCDFTGTVADFTTGAVQ